jgi:predicted house-cleaning noncanonical NTP pyrophosphatase (MazG superfamily)
MKKVYNKLVRDNIPEIIKADGHKFKTRKLKITEYKKTLLEKLLEESKEVVESQNRDELIKELADVQEVLSSIYEANKIHCSEVTKVARKRREKRGGFKKKIFLEYVE